ncbi:hypothetical protein IJH10_00200, partial [Candidatus Saccharibacteria bacterium]|nr:hypothetical protein [Candidatus Saccharibacteria bacterium]
SGEFQTLYNNYNSSALMQGDPAFVLSGYRSDSSSSTSRQGSYGGYWSSTAYSASRVHHLRLNSSDVSAAGNVPKYYGFSVRCIAQ